mgnify:CR=1 FL=1
MADVTREQIEEALKSYIEPHMQKNLIDTKTLKDVVIEGDKVKLTVQLGFPAKGAQDDISASIKETVEAVDGVSSCDVDLSWKVVAHSVQQQHRYTPAVRTY